jgi:DNA-binding transcriptional ArsR family regulator
VDKVFELQAEVLKALGNPRRLEIFRMLTRGPLEVGAIVDQLDIPQSGVSQHLAVMRAAGLIERDREGPGVRYRLADQDYVEACRIMHDAIRRRMARLAEASAVRGDGDGVEFWTSGERPQAQAVAAAEAGDE